jgi:hypothetical protein
LAFVRFHIIPRHYSWCQKSEICQRQVKKIFTLTWPVSMHKEKNACYIHIHQSIFFYFIWMCTNRCITGSIIICECCLFCVLDFHPNNYLSIFQTKTYSYWIKSAIFLLHYIYMYFGTFFLSTDMLCLTLFMKKKQIFCHYRSIALTSLNESKLSLRFFLFSKYSSQYNWKICLWQISTL